MHSVPINYWAVLVCGVAAMLVGYIYYGPLFGKLYSRMMGFDQMYPAVREEMMKKMGRSYFVTFIGSLVTAFILDHAIIFAASYMDVSMLASGLITAVMSWLGFMAFQSMATVMWDRESWKQWFLSNGHNLIQLLVFGVIFGLWK